MTTHQPSSQPLPADETRWLTIGELAEATGLTAHTLRAWETRHGFPVPTRLASGHRRYSSEDVRAVQRVVQERDRGLRIEQAIDLAKHAGDALVTGSVYASLTHRDPTLASYVLSKQTLLALSWAIEDECAALAGRGVLVGTFQRGRFTGRTRSRWQELSRTAAATLVMADFPDHDDQSLPARVALPHDSALLREWIVACVSPQFSAALVAWELPGQDDLPDLERQFEAVWSVDGQVARMAAESAARVGAALGSVASRRALRQLEDGPAPGTTSVRAATAVFNRMVAYTDGTVLRGRKVQPVATAEPTTGLPVGRPD